MPPCQICVRCAIELKPELVGYDHVLARCPTLGYNARVGFELAAPSLGLAAGFGLQYRVARSDVAIFTALRQQASELRSDRELVQAVDTITATVSNVAYSGSMPRT